MTDVTKEDRKRARSCQRGYKKALQAAERERKRAETHARRAQRYADKVRAAQEKAFLKEEAKWHKIREAEGELVELPALVTRDGTVMHANYSIIGEVFLAAKQAMCLDCETSGYWIGHKHYELRTIQLGDEHAAIVFDALDPEQLRLASIGLNMAEKLHAHSATADITPCVEAGLISWDDAWGKMHDSVIKAKLTDPKLSGSEADKLKELADDLLKEYATAPAAEKAKNLLFKAMGCKIAKLEASDPKEVNGWYMVNRFSETMIRYAGSDVLDLGAVLRVLPTVEEAYTFPFDVPEQRKAVAEQVIERERRLQGEAARIAWTGFKLDPPHIKSKIAEHESHKSKLKDLITAFTDGKISNPSASGVGETLIEMYPHLDGQLEVSEKTGKPSASKNSLEKLRGDGPEITLSKSILAYRHDVTSLSLLLRPLENLCDQGDARMRPTVYTINADTGRMSCVRPNGQQFSRQGGIRASVVADAGYVRINADLSGCEIRVAAALSGDRQLLEAETSPLCYRCQSMCDNVENKNCPKCGPGKGATGLHWMAAIYAFGLKATKEHRYWCKRIIFSKLFGGSAEAGARQVGIDVEESQKIHDAFAALAPVYTAWDKWLRNCYFEGSVVFRDFEEGENYRFSIPQQSRRGIYRTYTGRQIYINAPHAFGNYAIQGTAREILVDGFLEFSDQMKLHPEWMTSALMPVHDEILAFVRAEYFEEATRALHKAMQSNALSSPGFDVFIDADPELVPAGYWEDSS